MRIQCKYRGIRGFVTCYNDALRFQYVITEKANRKAKILVFWEKYGLETTIDAFGVKRRTLYNWKKQWESGGKKIEALNEKSKAPKKKRKRLWDKRIIAEIKRIRWDHANLGKDKIHPELKKFL